MATSFGTGEGRVDLRRLATNPVVLGAVLVVAVAGVYFWRRHQTTAGSAGAAPVTGQLAGITTGTPQNAADQLGLVQGGLNDQLGALTAQVSAGFAGLQTQLQHVPPQQFSAPTTSAPAAASSVMQRLPGYAVPYWTSAPLGGFSDMRGA